MATWSKDELRKIAEADDADHSRREGEVKKSPRVRPRDTGG
jgi:hypothetical protein